MAKGILPADPPGVCPCGNDACAGNARRAHESRVAQGLEPFVTNPAQLERIARISAAAVARAGAA